MDSDKTPTQNSDPAASPLSGMLATLLSHPEMLEQIQSAIGKPQFPPAGEAPAAQSNAGDSTPAGAPAVDGLASVLANPEMMAKLPQVMAVLKPMFAGEAGKHPPGHPARSHEDCRNDLLLALKPFLSSERRNAVDAILRIAQLGTVIRQIK